MLKKLAIICALMTGCTDLGETVTSAVGLNWTWHWKEQAACADGSVVVFEEGDVCTDNIDAWEHEAFPQHFDPDFVITSDVCGSTGGREQLSVQPKTAGACW